MKGFLLLTALAVAAPAIAAPAGAADATAPAAGHVAAHAAAHAPRHAATHGKIKLPRVLGDNMVLQRDMPLKLWGWAQRGDRITVEFHGKKRSTKVDAHGQWRVTLPSLSAGGPYDMSVRGRRERITLKNILVGDVWLASGQSNMVFPLVAQDGFGGVIDAQHELKSAQNANIRLFAVHTHPAMTPQSDVESAGWQVASPATVEQFSAVAFLFGRELQGRYDVPIGLIEAACGGTPAETWVSADALQAFPDLEAEARRETSLPASAERDYDAYLKLKAAWYPLHGREDRGTLNGVPLWAAPALDDSHWPSVIEPQPWPRKALKDFDGTLWFRKSVELPVALVGKPVRVHLGRMLQADSTYFNGELIGETRGEIQERDYEVPGEVVREGRNVVTVRLTGAYQSGEGFVGMHGEPADLFVDVGTVTLPLDGAWSVQAGPDLTELPDVPALAAFRTPYPRAPALLFNGMIAPLSSYAVKGVIWYQGETNVGRAAQYVGLFQSLIKSWRVAWGYDMPFAFVQLAGFGHDRLEPWDAPGAALRDAQSQALSLPLTRMATAVDVGDENNIHPKNKQAVAHRLALAVANLAYGAPAVSTGPTFASLRIEGAAIRVNFSNIPAGLKTSSPGEVVKGFAIAEANGSFVWATASIDGNGVLVSNPAIQEPAAVRYDWANSPNGNLYGGDGLPALPFRTDVPFRTDEQR